MDCFKDSGVEKDNNQGADRLFSPRNGMGNINTRLVPDFVWNMSYMTELMIRRIAPFVSFHRLKYGNIGFRGSVTLMMRQCRIASIIPNLPEDVKYFLMKVRPHQAAGTENMAPPPPHLLRFDKREIRRVVTWLQSTGHPVWTNVEFDPGRLSRWGENDTGNLLDIVCLEVDEVDEKECDNDEGPAPDQLLDAEVEYCGLEVDRDENRRILAEAEEKLQKALRERDRLIQEKESKHNADNNAGDAKSDTDETSLNEPVFEAKEIESYDGFANPHVTEHFFGMTFPSLYPPVPVHHDLKTDKVVQTRTPHHTFNSGWRCKHATQCACGGKWHSTAAACLRSQHSHPCNSEDDMEQGTYCDTCGLTIKASIYHDYSAFSLHAEQAFTRDKLRHWGKYQMWRNDGRPAAHPVFPFVLHSLIQKSQMLGQARYTVHESPGVAEMTADELVQEIEQDGVTAFIRKLLINLGNVTNTSSYWRCRRNELRALVMYLQIKHGAAPTWFNTLSMAESHWPELRRVLAMHVSKVTQDRTMGRAIMENDAEFKKAVQTHEHIVTMYFAARCEHWYRLTLDELYGVVNYWYRFEFAKSRKSLHRFLAVRAMHIGHFSLGCCSLVRRVRARWL